ncbi:MAG: hypothetical protein PHR53_03100 [Bacteroidales bacterium]|nr:hypothetical protein [Bacteroidales bacterium]
MESIQFHKNQLNRKKQKQEDRLSMEWEYIKNPFKQYIPLAKSAVKTLTLIPVLMNSFSVGKQIFSMIYERFQGMKKEH